MAENTKATPASEALPFWAEGQVTRFAFEALKQCKAPYGYTGKPATMRKLAGKGLVRQIEGGAYVVTEEGIDLIEGRCRCPAEFDWREANPYYPDDYGYPSPPRMEPSLRGLRQPSQGAAGMAQAEPVEGRPYAVEAVSGGCHVIRPLFGSKRHDR